MNAPNKKKWFTELILEQHNKKNPFFPPGKPPPFFPFPDALPKQNKKSSGIGFGSVPKKAIYQHGYSATAPKFNFAASAHPKTEEYHKKLKEILDKYKAAEEGNIPSSVAHTIHDVFFETSFDAYHPILKDTAPADDKTTKVAKKKKTTKKPAAPTSAKPGQRKLLL